MKPRRKHVRSNKKSYTKKDLGYWNGIPKRIKRDISKKLEFIKDIK